MYLVILSVVKDIVCTLITPFMTRRAKTLPLFKEGVPEGGGRFTFNHTACD